MGFSPLYAHLLRILSHDLKVMHISDNATPALASESGSIAIMIDQGRKPAIPSRQKLYVLRINTQQPAHMPP